MVRGSLRCSVRERASPPGSRTAVSPRGVSMDLGAGRGAACDGRGRRLGVERSGRAGRMLRPPGPSTSSWDASGRGQAALTGGFHEALWMLGAMALLAVLAIAALVRRGAAVRRSCKDHDPRASARAGRRQPTQPNHYAPRARSARGISGFADQPADKFYRHSAGRHATARSPVSRALQGSSTPSPVGSCNSPKRATHEALDEQIR